MEPGADAVDRKRVALGDDGAETAVAEDHAHQIRRQERRMIAGRELHRRDDRNPMVGGQGLPNLGQRLHRSTLGAGRGVPEMLVAALDGRPVAEAHAEDGLLTLRKYGEDAVRLAVRADDQRPRLDLAHPDETGRRQHRGVERLRFSHARTSGEDHQVARLEARG